MSMGVYIKGMEMPKDGFITITVTSDGRVVGNSKKENGKFEYLDNEDIAKAVPVPPHGRLIDADAEVEVWDVCGREGVFPHFTTTVSKFLLGHLVGKIPPTIILADPAEGGKT